MFDEGDTPEMIWTRIDAQFYTAHRQGRLCGSVDGQHGQGFSARNGAGYLIGELSSLKEAQAVVAELATRTQAYAAGAP